MRAYPPDIQQRYKKIVDEDVETHLTWYKNKNPAASSFAVYQEECLHRWLSEWWNEPHPLMTDDEVRIYLGLPVKSQDQIETEILAKRRSGFSVGELTGLDLKRESFKKQLTLLEQQFKFDPQ